MVIGSFVKLELPALSQVSQCQKLNSHSLLHNLISFIESDEGSGLQTCYLLLLPCFTCFALEKHAAHLLKIL